MKYFIEGFWQEELVKLGLDVIDSVLLRWFIDFYLTDKMRKVTIDGKQYGWLTYSYVIEDLPILQIKDKQTIANRFRKMVDCGLMEFYLDKESGNQTYFSVVESVFVRLISDEKKESLYGRTDTYKSKTVKLPNSNRKDLPNSTVDQSKINNDCEGNVDKQPSEKQKKSLPLKRDPNTIDTNTSTSSLSSEREETNVSLSKNQIQLDDKGDIVNSREFEQKSMESFKNYIDSNMFKSSVQAAYPDSQLDFIPSPKSSKPKKPLTPEKQFIEDFFTDLMRLWESLTGEKINTDKKLKNYYYGVLQRENVDGEGFERIERAVRNFAKQTFDRRLVRLFYDCSLFAKMAAVDPDRVQPTPQQLEIHDITAQAIKNIEKKLGRKI